jgi:hypothetical protein
MSGQAVSGVAGRFRVWPALANPGRWIVSHRETGDCGGLFSSFAEALADACRAESRFSWVHPRYGRNVELWREGQAGEVVAGVVHLRKPARD